MSYSSNSVPTEETRTSHGESDYGDLFTSNNNHYQNTTVQYGTYGTTPNHYIGNSNVDVVASSSKQSAHWPRTMSILSVVLLVVLLILGLLFYLHPTDKPEEEQQQQQRDTRTEEEIRAQQQAEKERNEKRQQELRIWLGEHLKPYTTTLKEDHFVSGHDEDDLVLGRTDVEEGKEDGITPAACDNQQSVPNQTTVPIDVEFGTADSSPDHHTAPSSGVSGPCSSSDTPIKRLGTDYTTSAFSLDKTASSSSNSSCSITCASFSETGGCDGIHADHLSGEEDVAENDEDGNETASMDKKRAAACTTDVRILLPPRDDVDVVDSDNFGKTKGRLAEGVCNICLVEYETGDDVVRAAVKNGCHHVFHNECITSWLCQSKENCPICRQQFVKLPAVLDHMPHLHA